MTRCFRPILVTAAASLTIALTPGRAVAQTAMTGDVASPPQEVAPRQDPTGGAYASPTLLFIPAAAVPVWNARVIVSSELQSPSDVDAGFRPGLGAELGLPAGFTLGAGTNWVGGDVSSTGGKTDFNLGLSPYAQGRFQILGRADGRGFLLGTAVTYTGPVTLGTTAGAMVSTSSIERCRRPFIRANTRPHSTSACAPRGELP